MQFIINPKSKSKFLKPGKKSVVLFLMTHCPYCKKFKPAFENFASTHSDKYEFAEVFLDDYDNPFWGKFDINIVPSIILFEGAKIINTIYGKPGYGLDKKNLERIPV